MRTMTKPNGSSPSTDGNALLKCKGTRKGRALDGYTPSAERITQGKSRKQAWLMKAVILSQELESCAFCTRTGEYTSTAAYAVSISDPKLIQYLVYRIAIVHLSTSVLSPPVIHARNSSPSLVINAYPTSLIPESR
jgi:hypothetical protein